MCFGVEEPRKSEASSTLQLPQVRGGGEGGAGSGISLRRESWAGIPGT